MTDNEMLEAMRSMLEAERERTSRMLDEKLDEKLKPMQSDIQSLQAGQSAMQSDIQSLQAGQSAMQSDIAEMKKDIREIKEQIKDIDESIGAIADWADDIAFKTKVPFAGGGMAVK